jgi:probable rRNA maturation factor
VAERVSLSVEVQIDARYKDRVDPRVVYSAASLTVSQLGSGGPQGLVVVVVSDDAIRELNRRHLGIDEATDVLAFLNEPHDSFVDGPGLSDHLGDVVISFDRAENQAEEAGHTVEDELQLLAVHGTLHLLGFDDVDAVDRIRMWEAQASVLSSLGARANLPD